MKKTLLTIAITLSLLTGFSTVNTFAASSNVSTAESNGGRIYIKVYEDGAIWVYVYEEDGTFVGKIIDDNF